jgi:hypothetical protein
LTVPVGMRSSTVLRVAIAEGALRHQLRALTLLAPG